MESPPFITNRKTEYQRSRGSPLRKQNALGRKSLHPALSAIISDRNKPQSKEELIRIHAKLQLIKSKCMKSKPRLNNSRKTLPSGLMAEPQLNESFDLDEEEPIKGKQNKAHLIKSQYEDRPERVFFHYPKCCQQESKYLQRVNSIQKAELTYKISGQQYKCIINCLQQNGFIRWQGGNEWNVFFDTSGTHLRTIQSMDRLQKFNHFPGCWNLGRKDYMWKHLNKQRRSHPDCYQFVPTTYLLPFDYQRFQAARQNADRNQFWILKPCNQACGRGIRILTKDTKFFPKKDTLISHYIGNPHLINGIKYDLRLYVLVTSYDPLRIYLFKQGLVRFATHQYTSKLKDVKKRFVHLTNFSVNKHSKKFVKNCRAELDGQGSKWSLSALRRYYEAHGINAFQLFEGIKDIVIKTCIAAEPVMLDAYSKTQDRRRCGFEMYGFDILVDERLKPWLMEVNVCPSLSSSSPIDRKIKHTLLTDTLNMIGLEYHMNRHKDAIKKNKNNERLFNRETKKYFSKNIHNLQNLAYANCVDILTPDDWQIIFEFEEQLERRGNYECVFPLRSNIDRLGKLFEFDRYNNLVLWKAIKSNRSYLRRLYEQQ